MIYTYFRLQFSSVTQLCPTVTPWTVASQASLSNTNCHSLFKLMSIESVMLSNHLILCHVLLLVPSIFPSIRVFPMSQFFTSGGQRIGISASASVLPINIQDWFPLGLTGLISFPPHSSVSSGKFVWGLSQLFSQRSMTHGFLTLRIIFELN